MLMSLLPPGLAWPRDEGTGLDKVLTAEAVELTRVDTSVQDLLTESYPLTSNNLLTDWERVTGLPNACVGAPETVQLRREAVDQKLATTGGQSPGFFIDLAASIGFEVTITEYTPFRVGSNGAGDPINSEEWAYVWQINAPEETIRDFEVGSNAVGEGLRTWGNELLECVITQYQPAHTRVLFSYQG